ncbi:uncharacterized protein LOC129743772 [Uranotaenia lowii]|uniref:uncharacterized protein LOC129743772 n=1 Tax=Uranotaenia lowii TaxID=190385 RepID=UPI002479DCBF|nr:uncharacterized protein LOC129743772 [Uranotaenia lowii]
MIKFLLTFGAGVYTGVYLSQNFEVPRVDEPSKLWERTNDAIKDFMDQHKKP